MTLFCWQEVKIQLLTNCPQLVMCEWNHWNVNTEICLLMLSTVLTGCPDCAVFRTVGQHFYSWFLLVIWSLAFGTGTGKCRHHTIDCLQERGMERGSARQSSLKGRKRVVIDQMNIGTVLKGSTGDTSECIDTIFNWTGKFWVCDSSWGDQMTDTNMEDSWTKEAGKKSQ